MSGVGGERLGGRYEVNITTTARDIATTWKKILLGEGTYPATNEVVDGGGNLLVVF